MEVFFMKFIKMAKKAVFCPLLGVFLTIFSLSLLNSPIKAMERHIITEPQASATVPTASIMQVIPALRTATMSVAPEMSNSSLDELTDDETRIYLPEAKKVKITSKKTIVKFPCTYEGCIHKASNKHNLTQHMKIHTGAKNFQCKYPGCRYAAYYKCHIRVHMKRTHKLENQ